MKKYLLITMLLICATTSMAAAKTCVGRFVNPLTDVCWKCIFPIRIAGMQVAKGKPDPNTSPKTPLCKCMKGPIPEIGFPIAFWEPARLIDVTRIPYCLVNLGGMSIMAPKVTGQGDVDQNTDDGTKQSFYQVHWYVYPVFYLLEVLMEFTCAEQRDFDLAYLTELDPFWADDEKGAILNPEGIVFGNPIAQAACAADCIAATAHLPIDSLFWCAGCLGSIYPFGGHVNETYGNVQTSSLIAIRFMAKLHREGLMREHAGKSALCNPYIWPLISKSHYRLQMTYPVPQTNDCKTLGHTDVTWAGGKEFSFKGEDFGYMVWRKRDCCLRMKVS